MPPARAQRRTDGRRSSSGAIPEILALQRGGKIDEKLVTGDHQPRAPARGAVGRLAQVREPRHGRETKAPARCSFGCHTYRAIRDVQRRHHDPPMIVIEAVGSPLIE